ncbi:MAG TPA: hypothetical protein VJL29_01990 [Thermoguttaceae bacterium]|nr:hypothetical protein [Thermoguttaceae bacterium]
MSPRNSTTWIVLLAIVVLTGAATEALAQAPPEAPPVSKYAPAKDLAEQVDYYVGRLEESVASPEDYKDYAERLAKDANTLTVIALALGLHDENSRYKAAAPAIIKASRQLGEAKDYASAKKAVEEVKKSISAKDDPAALKWEKVAVLRQLMLAVPAVNTQLKRNIKLRRPKKDAPKAAGRAAVIAVIGQSSLYHSGDTTKPELAAQWYKYCEEMRDAAAEVNKATQQVDKPAARKGMQKLQESCDHCHKVFHEAALGKQDVVEE